MAPERLKTLARQTRYTYSSEDVPDQKALTAVPPCKYAGCGFRLWVFFDSGTVIRAARMFFNADPLEPTWATYSTASTPPPI
jgi:hypothetical protein